MNATKPRIKFLLSAVICLLFSGFSENAKAIAADTIMVMPFENRSQLGEYNWIRDSFGILMSNMLDVPGVAILGSEERNLAFDKLKLSPNDLLTRAAMIRIADAARANLALIGEFDIGGEKENTSIAINARLIETQEGRLVGNKVFNLSGPLSSLQQLQGQLAWNILNLRIPSLPYSKEQLAGKSSSTPPRAYESFIKAVQTRDLKLREGFLRRAIQEFGSEGGSGQYTQAIAELGLCLNRQGKHAEAVKLLKQVGKDDPGYEESLFYLGLSAYRVGDNNEAVAALGKLAELVPMVDVFNNAGGVMLAKGDNANALQMLRRAVANSPNDPLYRFNYGYALWRNQNHNEAVENLREALKANPRDGEALFLLSKSLAAVGQQSEATKADNDARRYLANYAKWAVAPDRIPLPFRFKGEFNRAAFDRLEREQQAVSKGPTAQQISQRQSLDRARQLILENNDAEAANLIQRVLQVEGTNAEAYFLQGIIFYRRNETESAVKSLRTAVTYNPRLIEAHIALGRLYLARGDRALALAHSRQAIEIDPQNRDAIALKQQVETGR
ncbi:MAG: tetratricopeptide repeat protein [Blastocatellia bacterium]|nr:tetratricopeptide repeat protein [Blastocatellia bacterium]